MRGRVAKQVVACALVIGFCLLTPAFAVDVNWNQSIDNNYANPDNWDGGFRPAFFLDEIGVIGDATLNNVVANVSSTVLDNPGGVRIGFGTGITGTLNILNNGVLTVQPGNSVGGIVEVGRRGTGHFNISSGGTLNATGLILESGAGSTLTATGTAALDFTSDVTLESVTEIVGPSVDFSAGGDLLFDSTSLYNAQITSSTHSTMNIAGTATMGGALTLDFNGYSPTLGESWDLLDATTISGSFTSMTTSGFSPAPGEQLVLRTVSDNTSTHGQVARLFYEAEQSLVLTVDLISGEAQLTNASDQISVNIQGYDIASASGSLLPGDGDWNSLDDQNAAGGDWRESNVSVNRLAELKEAGAITLSPNGATLFDLGQLFDAQNGTPDLAFQYLSAGLSTPSLGEVLYTVAGDFDSDFDVDSDDLDGIPLGWQTQYGNVLNGNDFLTWQRNFGFDAAGTASLQAVPEPNAAVIISISAMVGLMRRRF